MKKKITFVYKYLEEDIELEMEAEGYAELAGVYQAMLDLSSCEDSGEVLVFEVEDCDDDE